MELLIGIIGALAALIMAGTNFWKTRTERRGMRLTMAGERAVDMIETYHDGLLCVGSDNRIIVANRQARFMTGYSARELEGMNVNDLLPPKYRKQHAIDIRQFRQNPRTRLMGKSGRALFMLTKRGEEVRVLLSLTPREGIDNGPEVTVGLRTAEETSALPVVPEAEAAAEA